MDGPALSRIMDGGVSLLFGGLCNDDIGNFTDKLGGLTPCRSP